MKLIACLAVITIHVRFPDPFGQYVKAIARFAVPFFFAVSGRYLLSGVYTTGGIRSRAFRSLKKTIGITVIVYTVYLLYSVLYHVLVGAKLSEVFAGRFNPGSIKRFLIFNTGTVIYDDSYVFDHMWYLFAWIYVLVVIIAAAPVLRKCYKPVMAVLLLALHIFTWMQDFKIVRVFGITLTTPYVLRSWFFTGIPYVLLGVLWGDIVEGLKKDKTTEDYNRIVNLWKIPGICFLSTGILSSCFETFIIGEKEIFIGSFFIVMGILLLSESLSEKGGLLSEMGREASSYIYFYHVLILAILNLGVIRGVFPPVPGIVKPVVLMILSIIIFYGLPKLYRSVINVKKG
ncbi:acyltransferase family protein [Butyrivibrio sp. AE3009]|uniref:acyltransferase family protein n=1 Tax=Butyrivibrio sp. AE3009 TaxID=1280666 RepID=UPI0018C93335|nr:acyltransferase family protein [Butyrivibrio sp. AE3009]